MDGGRFLFLVIVSSQTRCLKAADSAVWRTGAGCRQMEAGHAMVVAESWRPCLIGTSGDCLCTKQLNSFFYEAVCCLPEWQVESDCPEMWHSLVCGWCVCHVFSFLNHFVDYQTLILCLSKPSSNYWLNSHQSSFYYCSISNYNIISMYSIVAYCLAMKQL